MILENFLESIFHAMSGMSYVHMTDVAVRMID